MTPCLNSSCLFSTKWRADLLSHQFIKLLSLLVLYHLCIHWAMAIFNHFLKTFPLSLTNYRLYNQLILLQLRQFCNPLSIGTKFLTHTPFSAISTEIDTYYFRQTVLSIFVHWCSRSPKCSVFVRSISLISFYATKSQITSEKKACSSQPLKIKSSSAGHSALASAAKWASEDNHTNFCGSE